jgi:hypothetical protein
MIIAPAEPKRTGKPHHREACRYLASSLKNAKPQDIFVVQGVPAARVTRALQSRL